MWYTINPIRPEAKQETNEESGSGKTRLEPDFYLMSATIFPELSRNVKIPEKNKILPISESLGLVQRMYISNPTSAQSNGK